MYWKPVVISSVNVMHDDKNDISAFDSFSTYGAV